MQSLSSLFFVSLKNDGDTSPMNVTVPVSVSKEREVVTQRHVLYHLKSGAAIQSEAMGCLCRSPEIPTIT